MSRDGAGSRWREGRRGKAEVFSEGSPLPLWRGSCGGPCEAAGALTAFPGGKPVSFVIGENGKKPLAGPAGCPGAAAGAAALRRDPAAEDERWGGAKPGCPLEVFCTERILPRRRSKLSHRSRGIGRKTLAAPTQLVSSLEALPCAKQK